MELPASFRGAVLVMKGHDVVLEEYRGAADVRDRTAVTDTTRFQLCSVSKQFAAACIQLLAETGTLSIDDPVAHWFPGSPPSWSSITLANLLTHTAGLGHWPDYAAIDPTAPIDDDAYVAAAQDRPLPAELPAPHAHSSIGYGLLARVVERASGHTYARFVGANIFEPLGMRDSFVGDAHDHPCVARGYHGADERPSWDLDRASKGAGDIWTTARDLDRWDQAMLSDALLPSEARELMFRPTAPVEWLPDVIGYGFGWMIGELHGRTFWFHPGDNPGFVAFNVIVPGTHGRVIVLSNDETTDIFTPAMQFLEATVA